jgi:hypothetical protein
VVDSPARDRTTQRLGGGRLRPHGGK